MYSFSIKEHLDRVFGKLSRKNPKQLEIIHKKIAEVIRNPHHYKNLRRPLQHLRRVHIDRHFVLLFSVHEDKRHVVFEEYDHHDYIYR